MTPGDDTPAGRGQPGPNPAQEKTLPYERPPTTSNKETVSGKHPSVETVKEKRPEPPPTFLTGEATLRQDEKDRRSAQDSSSTTVQEAPPTVSGYVIEEKLGQGTYGVVWRATEVATNKRVAIKFFFRRLGEMWQIVWAEVKQLAMLDSVRGIIQLKDADPSALPPYFVMSYAEGGSLAHLIKKGRVPVPKALQLFRDMVEAMAYVHAKGIRHCDLKPANILLDTLGKPLVADFGQAHLSLESQTSSVNLGTFYFMAPEQADLNRQIPDTRWDVYSLGAIFYSLLVAEPPRASPDLTGSLNNTTHLNTRLSRYQEGVAKAAPPEKHRALPGMDRPLADIVEKCLHLDPAQRYQNASEILHALDQREQYLRKRPLVLGALAASLLLLVALGTLAFLLVHTSLRDTQEALESQIKHDDRTTVQLIANVVGEKIGESKDQVRRLASNEKLFARMHEQQGDLGLVDTKSFAAGVHRDLLSTRGLEDELRKSWRRGIHLLIFYDLEGRILAGAYPEKNPVQLQDWSAKQKKKQEDLRALYGRAYDFRDYYHGRGDDRPGEKHAYINEPYVSEPLQADSDKPGILKLGISTPVHPLKNVEGLDRLVPDFSQPPIGILVGFIYLNDDNDSLNSWLKGVDVSHGCAILLNHHGQCVFCTDKHYKLEPVSGKATDRFPEEQKFIQDHNLGFESHYRAKIVPHASLASFASVKWRDGGSASEWNPEWKGQAPWGVMVLHYRHQVFEPIENLKERLFLVIAVAGAVCATILIGVWIWLLRALRGKEVARAG